MESLESGRIARKKSYVRTYLKRKRNGKAKGEGRKTPVRSVESFLKMSPRTAGVLALSGEKENSGVEAYLWRGHDGGEGRG